MLILEVISNIKDIKEELKEKLIEKYKNSNLSLFDLQKEVNELLKIKCVNKASYYYWTCRGWTKQEAKEKRTKLKHKNSPFQIKFWINKGYTEEQAKEKINSFRKTNIQYWINKGYTEEQAKEKVSEFSSNAGKQYSKYLKKYPENYTGIRNTQLQYWINKGYTEEQAKEKVSNRQSTCSKENFIKLYGNKIGTEKYNKRTEKWLTTLNNKSIKEKNEINLKKSCSLKNTIMKYGRDEGIKKFLKHQKINEFYFNYNEYIKHLINILKEKYYYLYTTFEYFSKYNIKQYYLDYFNITKNDIKTTLKENGIIFPKENIIFQNNFGKFKHWKLITNNGKILRSSNEINFYHLLNKFNIDYEIEKYYINTKLRCDFYLPKYNYYIEICGDIKDKSYIEKMKYKQNNFNAILLFSLNEQKDFIERLINEKDLSMYVR
jgi:hypothetical protein